MPEAPELPDMPEATVDAPEMPSFEAPEPMPVEEEHEHVEPETPHHMNTRNGPMFVSVQDYQLILNGVAAIKGKLAETDESFKKLQTIKQQQDKQLDDWRATLEDVQQKLTYVDDVLFEKR